MDITFEKLLYNQFNKVVTKKTFKKIFQAAMKHGNHHKVVARNK